jgi:hypothetical protein
MICIESGRSNSDSCNATVNNSQSRDTPVVLRRQGQNSLVMPMFEACEVHVQLHAS